MHSESLYIKDIFCGIILKFMWTHFVITNHCEFCIVLLDRNEKYIGIGGRHVLVTSNLEKFCFFHLFLAWTSFLNFINILAFDQMRRNSKLICHTLGSHSALFQLSISEFLS